LTTIYIFLPSARRQEQPEMPGNTSQRLMLPVRRCTGYVMFFNSHHSNTGRQTSNYPYPLHATHTFFFPHEKEREWQENTAK